MRIQAAATYLVSARLGNHSLAETCYHWPYQHNRTAQTGAPFQEFIAFQIGQIYIGSLKAICIDIFL